MRERTVNEQQGQMKYQLQAWLDTLSRLQQETISLKNTLAGIIKNEIGKDALEQAEYFQNQFLNKDAIIGLLRQDIATQNKNIAWSVRDNATQLKQVQLQKDIALMEKQFEALKTAFSSYTSKIH